MTKNLESRTPLDILAYAISDAGLWSWCVPNFPDGIQLEFDRTMLHFEPKSPERPPLNKIAIRFIKPKSVLLLRNYGCFLAEEWIHDFHSDKLRPFGINSRHFSFEVESIRSMIEKADKRKTFFGEELNDSILLNSAVKIGFWAGEVGIVVVAEDMKILTHEGELQLEEISARHSKWWDYWSEYWQAKESGNPLPHDYLCEITIPVGGGDIKGAEDILK